MAIFMILRIFSSGISIFSARIGRIRLEAGFLQDLAGDAVHLVDGLDHVHRDADGAGLVGDRAGDGLADPPGGVGRELVAAAVFELVHRLHQADVAFLDQVEELQAAVGVLLGDGDHQTQVGLDHLLLGVAAPRLRRWFMRLLMSLSSDSGTTTRVCRSISFCCSSCTGGTLRCSTALQGLPALACCSTHCRFNRLGGEVLDEGVLRHAALVHDDAAQLAFLLAHVVHLGAHHVTQLLDGLGREADGHQLGRDGVLDLHVRRAAVAVLVVHLVHLVEVLAQLVEAAQGLVLQLLELLGQRFGAALAVVVVGFVVFVEVFFGHVVVGLVRVDEAIDHGR